MKNKNRIYRAAALLLVLCFISTVMISGTFAKYTSEFSGEDTALVARWSFTSDTFGESYTAGETFKLPIWDHNYVENIYQKDEDNYLIAPGVSGEFTVGFEYDADVDADLTFKFEKSGNTGTDNKEAAKVPIQYSIDNFTTVYYDLDELADAIIGEAKIGNNNVTITKNEDNEGVFLGTYLLENTETEPVLVDDVTVSWRWPYYVSEHSEVWTDADDTAIGLLSQDNGGDLGRDSYVLTLTMKATQRMPGSTEQTP